MSGLSEYELCAENLDEEPTLQKEKTWGVSFRQWSHVDDTHPVSPKHSPINVPFNLCRVLEAHKPKKRKKKACNCAKGECTVPQISLLDRSALPQDKYMALLAIPNKNYAKQRYRKKFRRRNKCCKCRLFPLCRPRIIQMAVPKKRYVWENWKTYQHFLPAEMLLRFDEILKSGDNLEPNIARCYFKQLQKKKRKELKRRKQMKRRKRWEMEKGDRMWIEYQVNETVDAIFQYIQCEPLFNLNYQQMMTSTELFGFLHRHKVVTVRTRNTKSVYKKTVIEITDKVVKWMDSIRLFADMQPVSSREKFIKIPSLESLLGEEEEIEETEEEEEEEQEGREGEGEGEEGEEGLLEEEGIDMFEDEEGEVGYGIGIVAKPSHLGPTSPEDEFMAKKIFDKTNKFFDDYEGEGSLIDMLRNFDEDILEKLIQILSESPVELLDEEIDPENMPGVTYGDILAKLKEIRDGNLLEIQRRKPFLEDKMIEWAKNNDPEQVDDKILDKIHETSTILAEWFKNADVDTFKKKKGTGKGDEEEEWGEGEDGLPMFDEIFKTGRLDQETIKEVDEEEGEGEGGGEDGGEGGREDGGEGGREDGGEGGREGEEDDDETGKRRRKGPHEEYGEGEYGEGYDEEGYDEEDIGWAKDLQKKMGKGEQDYVEEYGEGEEGYGPLYPRGYEEGDEEKETRPGMEEESEEMAEEGEEQFGLGKELGEGEEEAIGKLEDEIGRLDSLFGIIRGHKPSVVFEHEPGTICCLSLKIWAVWLLQIANNAHNWTRWIGDIIRQVRQYAAIIRGDVLTPTGEKKVLYKEDWRKFVKDTEEKVIAWRQYSKHVKDLSTEIMENFHGKKVNCCPKCLQDHLIKNVVTAHETLLALTEAINCAGYWQRCLDRIVEQTSKLTDIDVEDKASLVSVESSYSIIEIEELSHMPRPCPPRIQSDDSVYEIEELHIPQGSPPVYEILELEVPPPKPPKRKEPSHVYIIEDFGDPPEEPSDHRPKKSPSGNKKNKKKGKK